MIKRKRKGFTIVELVIVIAVIAVLAAVLIPTFASIIARANQSADIQAVRQMNVALATESAISPPKTLKEVIKILSTAGYNAEDKLIPVSKNHGFYWCKSANLIALIKDEDVDTPELIFPLDNETLKDAVTEAESDWAGALAVAEPVFYDLGEKAEEILEEIEQEASAGGGITNATDLKTALEAGGTVTLGGDVTIETADQAIEILEGTTTLDLNGKTLTLDGTPIGEEAYHDITVNGGTLNITGGNLVINLPENNDAWDFNAGISVYDGTLKLDGIRVTCNSFNNIQSIGNVVLTNTNFTVNSGFGFADWGGTSTINGGSFVANGAGVRPVYCDGGTTSITGTTFTEGDAFGSYAYYAPIDAHGNVTLEDVNVTTGDEEYSVFAGSSSTVVVKSGTYNTKFHCVGDTTSVTIYGGTINRVAYGDFETTSQLFDGSGFTLTQGEGCWVISKPQT